MADLSSYKYKDGTQTKTFENLFINTTAGTTTSYSTYISPDNNNAEKPYGDKQHYGSTNTGAKTDEPSNYFYINDTDKPLAEHIYYPPIIPTWGVEEVANGWYVRKTNDDSGNSIKAIKRGYAPADIAVTGIAANTNQNSTKCPAVVNALVTATENDPKLFTYFFTGTRYPDEEAVEITYDRNNGMFTIDITYISDGKTKHAQDTASATDVLGYAPTVFGFGVCGAGGHGHGENSTKASGGGGGGVAFFLINFDDDKVTQLNINVGAGSSSGKASDTIVKITSTNESTTNYTCGAGQNAAEGQGGAGGSVSIDRNRSDLPLLGIQPIKELSGKTGTAGAVESSGINIGFNCFSSGTDGTEKSHLHTEGAINTHKTGRGVGGGSLGQGGYAEENTGYFPLWGGGGRGNDSSTEDADKRGAPGGFFIWY